MFDSLTEKLQRALADVRNRGALSEQDVDAALRTIRLALLEADVNLKVVRQFTAALSAAITRNALFVTLPLPSAPAAPIVSVPAETIVPPV